MVPSESSSGKSRSQSAITKTGNTHARRLLAEAAWHHRKRHRPGKTLRARWINAPPAARIPGQAGNERLYRRWQEFTRRHKRPAVANVAIARELAGWCWSPATLPDWRRPVDRSTDACGGASARSDPRRALGAAGKPATLDL